MRHRNAILLVLLAVTGLLALWLGGAEKLTFRPLAKPEGFRELVLQKPSSSAAGFLTGLQQSGKNSAVSSPGGAKLNICEALYRDPASPSSGSAQSSLTIVEFFDYRCPYCKTLSQMLADIQGRDARIKVIYKEWPILSKSSGLAARAALAADRQQKYTPFHRRIMKAKLIPNWNYIEHVAKQLGLDTARLRKNMAADEITRALSRNAKLASALGLIGTPALVVGRTIVQGGISRGQLDRLIEIELQAAQPETC